MSDPLLSLSSSPALSFSLSFFPFFFREEQLDPILLFNSNSIDIQYSSELQLNSKRKSVLSQLKTRINENIILFTFSMISY